MISMKIIIKKTIVILLGLFLLIFGLMLIFDYRNSPSNYHFGTEVAGFAYYSSFHYQAVALMQSVAGLIAILFGVFNRMLISISFLVIGLILFIL